MVFNRCFIKVWLKGFIGEVGDDERSKRFWVGRRVRVLGVLSATIWVNGWLKGMFSTI